MINWVIAKRCTAEKNPDILEHRNMKLNTICAVSPLTNIVYSEMGEICQHFNSVDRIR